MDGVDHGRIRITRRRSLKERLGLKGMGCCGGTTWVFRPTSTTINASDSEDEQQQQQHHNQLQLQEQLLQEYQQELTNREGTRNVSDPRCSSPAPVNSRGSNSMNLAAALAAERHFRAVEGTNLEAGPTNVDVHNNNNSSSSSSGSGGGDSGNNVGPTTTAPGTPLRMSLMRLLAETDGGDEEEEKTAAAVRGVGGGGGNDTVCCVCMIRKKGAAFIPCGHTFCRVCSREVWLNRGSCPLCNRSILEILDIF
ncbi:hypothetical protein ACOSQ3_012992 [Xanthoceras sorbifolium]